MPGGSEPVGPPPGTLTKEYLSVEDKKTPLKNERMQKRESKLSLRNIFTRQKSKRDTILSTQGTHHYEPPSSPGPSTSLSDIRQWPHVSDASLPTHMLRGSQISLVQPAPSPVPSLLSADGDWTSEHRSSKRSSIFDKEQLHPGSSSMPWPPPPLFQAYQQAVKHAMMSMCTVPTETLQRISDLTTDGSSGLRASDAVHVLDPKKKKHNRNTIAKNPIEFASKIYVLTTSSWLFQYAADGDYDRPPERALRITKGSAAFASDLIPGRHWVIQVMASTDTSPDSEARSRKSKLSLKLSDRRPSLSFLLVCETPEDMESWLAVLRQEIEMLGGKKKLSETGDTINRGSLLVETGHLSPNPSVQNRYSQIVREDFSWSQENALNVDKLEHTPELLQDDGSTTASLVSSEGYHLDCLRDSNGNRFSAASMEFRGLGTPPNASPTCSPRHSNFPPLIHEPFGVDGSPKTTKSPHAIPEVRARPNAAAILHRRRSRQTVNADLEVYTSGNRSRSVSIDSTKGDSAEHEYVSAPQSIPNFSIPQAVSRRFSALQTPAITINQPTPPSPPQDESPAQDTASRLTRRSPPTSLPLARPLSVVLDHPSPRSPPGPPPATKQPGQSPERVPARKSSLAAAATVPRRFISMNNLRASPDSSGQPRPAMTLIMPPSMRRPDPVREMERAQGLSPTVGRFGPSLDEAAAIQRTSMTVEFSHPTNYRYSMNSVPAALESKLRSGQETNLTSSTKALHQREPRTHLRPARTLMTQRSMPLLAEMPPPLPPPTCALPPLPPQHAPPTRALPTIPASPTDVVAECRSHVRAASTT